MPRATLPTRPSSAPATRPTGRIHLVARHAASRSSGDDYSERPRVVCRGRRPNRQALEADNKYFPNRRTRSPEQQREESMSLKRHINELSQELVLVQAANARLEQQNALQARQIETLLRDSDRGGAAVAGIQQHYERSLIVKRLRERIDDLLASLRERDDIITRLRRSHRNSVVLELETAKEEYFAELSRLNRALDRARAESKDPLDTVCTTGTTRVSSVRRIDHSTPSQSIQQPVQPSSPPPKKKQREAKKPRRVRSNIKKRQRPSSEPLKSVTEELLIIEDNDSQDSGNGAAAQHDALRLLYREAREIAINSVTLGFGVADQNPTEERMVYCRDHEKLTAAVWDTQNMAPDSAETLAYSNDTTNLHVSPHSNSTDQSRHRPGEADDEVHSHYDGSKSPQSPGALSIASRRAQYNSQTDLDVVVADMELNCYQKWMGNDDANTSLCNQAEFSQSHSTPGIQLDTTTRADTERSRGIRIKCQSPKGTRAALRDESRPRAEETNEAGRVEKASSRTGRAYRDRGECRPAKEHVPSKGNMRQRELKATREDASTVNEASERIVRACSKYLTCRSAKQDLRSMREERQQQAAEALQDAQSMSQASGRIARAYRNRILCRAAKEQLQAIRKDQQGQLDDMRQHKAQSLAHASARIGRIYRDHVACRSAKQLLHSKRRAQQSQPEAVQRYAQIRTQASARIGRAYRNSVKCRPAMDQLRVMHAEHQRQLEEESNFAQRYVQASARIGRAYRDSVKRRSAKEHCAKLRQESRPNLNQKVLDEEFKEKMQPESLTLEPVVKNVAHPQSQSDWNIPRSRTHDTDGTRPPSPVAHDRSVDKEAEEPASAAAQASTKGASVGDEHASQLARGEEAGIANDHQDDGNNSDTEYEDDFADD